MSPIARSRAWLLDRVIQQENGCWLWIGDRSRGRGYGRVYLGRDDEGGRRFESATSAFYREFIGPVPDEGWLLHRCDNPPCCNPWHLFIGDHAKNMRDMVERGRSLAGERHNMAKLTQEQVEAIRLDPRLQRVIAAEYGIRQSHVSRIKNRERWR